MPFNVVLHMFSFLERDDLDRCELVCSDWRRMVRLGNRRLPKRQVHVLEISSNHEFTAVFHCGSRRRTVSFQKYFGAL